MELIKTTNHHVSKSKHNNDAEDDLDYHGH
jgi:hypothetical protein